MFMFMLMFSLMFMGVANAGDAKQEEIKILILGDSLSAAHNMPVDQGWAHLFSSNIGASFPHTSVINASISGETTFGGLQRLPELLTQHQPSHLIIELGGNDGLRGLGFEQSTDNLRQMVRLAQTQQITVLLIGVRMPVCSAYRASLFTGKYPTSHGMIINESCMNPNHQTIGYGVDGGGDRMGDLGKWQLMELDGAEIPKGPARLGLQHCDLWRTYNFNHQNYRGYDWEENENGV